MLELLVELHLLGRKMEVLLQDSTQAAPWIQSLKCLRFPTTSASDQNGSDKLKSLPWPAHVETKWARQGDRSGIEIRIRAESQSELERKLQGLEHVSQLLKQEPGKLWSR